MVGFAGTSSSATSFATLGAARNFLSQDPILASFPIPSHIFLPGASLWTYMDVTKPLLGLVNRILFHLHCIYHDLQFTTESLAVTSPALPHAAASEVLCCSHQRMRS